MGAETFERSGGCSCREVRYRVLSDPLFVHGCHCGYCQRETGSALAINALIEMNHLEVTCGQVELTTLPTASGKGQQVARCTRCHVAVFSHYAYGNVGESLAFLRVGTLDDPGQLPPDIHIFTNSKQAWFELPQGVPAVPEYYRAADYWPARSLARRAHLFAAAKGP